MRSPLELFDDDVPDFSEQNEEIGMKSFSPLTHNFSNKNNKQEGFISDII